MRLDGGVGVRVSLVDCRIPQVIPSHRLARHARTLQHASSQQLHPLYSSSSSLHHEQRSIEESITAHRRLAMGDLGTATASTSPATATASHATAPATSPVAPTASAASAAVASSSSSPSLSPSAPPARALRVSIPEVEQANASSLPSPPPSDAPSGQPLSRSSSSSPSLALLSGEAVVPRSASRKSLRSPSPLSSSSSSPIGFSHSLAYPTPTQSMSASPLPDTTLASSSSTSSVSRPSARLQRIFRRMKGAAHAEEDEVDGEAENAAPLLHHTTTDLPLPLPHFTATHHSQPRAASTQPYPVMALPAYSVDKGSFPLHLSAFSPVMPQPQPQLPSTIFSFVRPPTPTPSAPLPPSFLPQYSHHLHHTLPLPLPPPHYDQPPLSTMQHRGVPVMSLSPPSSSSAYVAVPAHLISTLPSHGVTMGTALRPFPMIV